jgi:hypothetical protein
VREKADSWWHDVSPSSRQVWLDSALQALKTLADAGLGAASVLANLHHRRIVPLMERWLRIFEMHEEADPRGAGAIAAATRSLSAGVRGHKGEARG